jgi:hypothetical protein
MVMNITELVKNKTAKFSHYQDGFLYFVIQTEDENFQFGVPLEEVKDEKIPGEAKATHFLRWIKKWLISSDADVLITVDNKGDIILVNLDKL